VLHLILARSGAVGLSSYLRSEDDGPVVRRLAGRCSYRRNLRVGLGGGLEGSSTRSRSAHSWPGSYSHLGNGKREHVMGDLVVHEEVPRDEETREGGSR